MYIKALLFALAGIASVSPVAALAQDITFTESDRPIQYPAQTLIQGDINRDGYPDFLFGLNNSTNIYTLKSNGTGGYVNWTVATTYCPSVPLGFGDFQRSGKNDLLVSNTNGARCGGVPYSTTFADYLNDGAGDFHLYKQFPVSLNNADAGVVADYNHDQKLDVVILDGSRLELYYGDGHGNFAGPYRIATLVGSPASLTGPYFNLIAGDFDGNGCTDAAWTEYETSGIQTYNSQLRVAYGDCHGGFSVATPYNVTGEIDNIQTADLNRDGVSDIVATLDAAGQGVTNPTMQISYGHTNRTFSTKLISDSSILGPIQVADLNGDGYPDIAFISASSSGSAVKVLEGDAAQSFSRISMHGLPTGQYTQMLSGDYNRDGKTDLALLGLHSGSVFSLLTNTSTYPDGTCVPPVTPGIRVCSPGQTTGTTVKVLADATNVNPTVYMALYVDGVKRLAYGSTHELRGTITVPVGSHRFDYYSYDAAGIGNSLGTYVTVK